MAAVTPAPHRRGPLWLRQLGLGLAFVSPWLVGLLAFRAYPIAASFWYSLHEFRGLGQMRFVGLENYWWMLTKDLDFWTGVSNTLVYTLMAVPTGIIAALTVAIALNVRLRGQPIYRTIYFLPVLVPDVALSIVWLQMFNPQYGLVNTIIEGLAKLVGLDIVGPGWLASEVWAKPTLVLMHLWLIGHPIVIYLAALQDVPQELLDAAAVDGANWLRLTLHITIPMITPAIFFQLITSLIGAMQIFSQPWVITGGTGQPAQSLLFYSMVLYRKGFQEFNMGLGTAMAWMLFIAISLFTYLLFKSSARWVYYGGAEERR